MTSNRLLNNSKNFKDFIEDIGLLNVYIAPLERGVNDYGVLRSRSNDRYWLLPLFSKQATLSGLNMFQPMTNSAKLAHKMIERTIKTGFNKIWCKSTIGLNGLPEIDINFSQSVSSCAYFTGTSGPHRKSTIQLMAIDGSILGYIKISRNENICKFISNEAEILNKIRLLNLKSIKTPKLLSFKTNKKGTILITDTQRTNLSYSPISIGKGHINFLREISTITGKKANQLDMYTLTKYIKKIANKNLSIEWRNRLLSGSVYISENMKDLYLCVNHGDFTPWNIFLDNEGLYVFDWEYGKDLYPVGYDLTKFLLCLPNKIQYAEENNRNINLLADIYFEGDLIKSKAHYYISLILYSSFYLDRSLSSNLELWSEADKYANLIDSCYNMHNSCIY